MSISLVKGQKIDLTKGNAKLKKVVFALGWDPNRYDGDAESDLDVSAFFTDDSGKVTGEQDFVFYGQPQHPSGALTYSGDNRTGVGDGDDETMVVELDKIPANISKISFAPLSTMPKTDYRILVWWTIHTLEHMMPKQLKNCSNMS